MSTALEKGARSVWCKERRAGPPPAYYTKLEVGSYVLNIIYVLSTIWYIIVMWTLANNIKMEFQYGMIVENEKFVF